MSYKNALLLMVVLFLSHKGSSSDFKWGKVSDREKEITSCAYELDAPAVVLFDVGQMTVFYGRHWELKRHRRIKVLTKEGVGQASDMFFNFYSKDDLEQIISVKAQTINGSQITKVSKSEIHTVDLKNNSSQVRVSFPDVKEGSILEVSYKLISKSFTFLEAWNFQSEYPTLHSEVSATIEKGLNYRVMLNGNNLIRRYAHLTTNKWMLKNLHSLQEKEYVFNINDYAESIKFQLESYYRHDNLGYNDQSGTVTLLKDWASLVSDEHIQEWIGRYVGRRKASGKIVSSLSLENMETIEKVKIIHEYVSKQFVWDNHYSIKPDLNFNKLLDEKKGNSADINMFLVELLNEAGFEAYPAYLSTRSHGAIYKSYPFLSQFNHTIAALKLNGSYIFINATNSYRPFDMLSVEDMNKEVFVLNKNNPEWAKLPKPGKFEQIVSVNIDYTGLPKFNAIIEVAYKDYAALQKRQASTEELENSITNELAKYFDLTLDSMVVEDKMEIEKPLKVKSFITGTMGESHIYYLPFILNVYFSENPFKQNQRYYPIELNYPYKFYYISKIELPDKYVLSDFPKKEAGKLYDNSGVYTFNYNRMGKTITVTSSIELKEHTFHSGMYDNLKEFFSRIISKQEEQLVIIKE